MTSVAIQLLKGANRDTFYVRGIREDISHERGLNLCIGCETIRMVAGTCRICTPRILVRAQI